MDGRNMQRLRDALCGTFDADSLAQLLRFHLDKDLAQLVPPGGLRTVVFRLIELASKEDWLGDLIVAACDERPRNLTLQSFRSEHRQEVLGAKLAHVEDKVAEQQRLINQLVHYSMSASIFHHLCGIALLHSYRYYNDAASQRELYFLRDHGFIRPRPGIDFLVFENLHGRNLVEIAEPTEIGWVCVKLRKADVPSNMLDAMNRGNLRVDPSSL